MARCEGEGEGGGGEIGQEWDIIIPKMDGGEGDLEKIDKRAKGRVRRGRPHRSLAYGPGATEMPDMKNIADPMPQLSSVYDDKFFKAFSKPSYLHEDGAGEDKIEDFFERKVFEFAKINSEVKSTLKKLNKIIPKNKILTEQENESK